MRETFDPTWLALREEVDHRSRAPELVARLERWWTARGASTVLDLGSGTGSNLRYLAPRLPGAQRWTLLDHDAELLARVEPPVTHGRILGVAVRTVEGDLADAALAEVGAAHLVTASALLDLASEPWLIRLADTCAASGCAALFALTYDGAIEWAPDTDATDALVRRAVNEHQRRDKGLGTALGPAAAAKAEALFRARGYLTRVAPSPWLLHAKDGDLVRALVDGWAVAAEEQSPADGDAIRAWAERRSAAPQREGFELTVGHQDLLALPPDASAPGA